MTGWKFVSVLEVAESEALQEETGECQCSLRRVTHERRRDIAY